MSVFHLLLLISLNDSCLQVITLVFKDGVFLTLSFLLHLLFDIVLKEELFLFLYLSIEFLILYQFGPMDFSVIQWAKSLFFHLL